MLLRPRWTRRGQGAAAHASFKNSLRVTMKRLAPCSTGPSKLAVALRRESDWRHCSLIPDRCILTVAIPMLAAIKLLHTVVWAILAGSIVVLPLTGVMRRFRWAAILSGLVLLECGVLAANGGRCPLSDLAQRFTDSHANNFDIYLSNWLAQYNKVIFGVLFIAGELVVLGCWFRERSAKHQSSGATTATSNFE